MNWFALDTHISDGRNADYRKLANNTYAERRGDDIVVRLHKTDVLTFHATRPLVTYDTGGWFTVTTKNRMDRFGPGNVSVGSHRGEWSLWIRTDHGNSDYRYFDGMTINPDTNGYPITNPEDAPNWDVVDSENTRTRRMIAEYLRGFTDDIIGDLANRSMAGDCFFCQSGNIIGGNEHLREHLRERYYMGSLVVNAYRASGYPDEVIGTHVALWPSQVRETVGRYLRKQLLAGVEVTR